VQYLCICNSVRGCRLLNPILLGVDFSPQTFCLHVVEIQYNVHAGSFAINPVNGERLPVWVADYVLGSYGTGAIMAVPAHDSRDHEFAQAYGLPIKRVVDSPKGGEELPFVGAPRLSCKSDHNRHYQFLVQGLGLWLIFSPRLIVT
jgi:hypothetical protein